MTSYTRSDSCSTQGIGNGEEAPNLGDIEADDNKGCFGKDGIAINLTICGFHFVCNWF